MILQNPIHHIGVATQDIQQELFTFECFGFHKEAEFIDKTQGVRGIFLVPQNSNMPQYRFELLENLDVNGPLSSYIQTKTKMYHIAYETKHIESDLAKLLTLNGGGGRRVMVVKPILHASYFTKICFVMFKNHLLIELVEK